MRNSGYAHSYGQAGKFTVVVPRKPSGIIFEDVVSLLMLVYVLLLLVMIKAKVRP